MIKILISRTQLETPLENINCFTYNPSYFLYNRIFIKIKFFKIDKFSFYDRVFFDCVSFIIATQELYPWYLNIFWKENKKIKLNNIK